MVNIRSIKSQNDIAGYKSTAGTFRLLSAKVIANCLQINNEKSYHNIFVLISNTIFDNQLSVRSFSANYNKVTFRRRKS